MERENASKSIKSCGKEGLVIMICSRGVKILEKAVVKFSS